MLLPPAAAASGGGDDCGGGRQGGDDQEEYDSGDEGDAHKKAYQQLYRTKEWKRGKGLAFMRAAEGAEDAV